MVHDPREQALRWIQQLAGIERPSTSPGERQAAEWIVEQLAEGATPARIAARRLCTELVAELDDRDR